MWFDVTAALAEIDSGQSPAPRPSPATSATSATKEARVANVASVAAPHCENSVATQSEAATGVADVANVAARQAPAARHSRAKLATSRPTPSKHTEADMRPHDRTSSGIPRIWTGRVVSLDEWRKLTAWDRHRPQERIWCGLCRAWHLPGVCVEDNQ